LPPSPPHLLPLSAPAPPPRRLRASLAPARSQAALPLPPHSHSHPLSLYPSIHLSICPSFALPPNATTNLSCTPSEIPRLGKDSVRLGTPAMKAGA
jgi:hypothetical protein